MGRSRGALRVFDVDPETGHYRRFFDIDDLAGVRVEDPAVFELTHGKVLSLLAEGVIEGLRVDHPDGLADPAGYLERLAGAGAARVWVEKILSHPHPPEQLRDWPVSAAPSATSSSTTSRGSSSTPRARRPSRGWRLS